MGYYSKNIAVIRGLKSGFSADGGPLSGLIKAEKYGSSLKIEASLINFAPLTEGRYVIALSDGKHTCILEGTDFEGASEVNTSSGFAALVCYVNGTVSPVAAAVCGNFRSAAIGLKEEIEKQEQGNLTKLPPVTYEDEALAEENYYEYEQTFKDGGTVRENPQKEADGRVAREDETSACAVQSREGAVEDISEKISEAKVTEKTSEAGISEEGICEAAPPSERSGGAAEIPPERDCEEKATEIPLARGNFYGRMKGEIEGVLSGYPAEENLEEVVENSRWVRITYGDGKFYVFGVIYGGGIPQYICYGVPSKQSVRPPESLSGLASFIPAARDGSKEGYWVMYQDAATGASVKIDAQ